MDTEQEPEEEVIDAPDAPQEPEVIDAPDEGGDETPPAEPDEPSEPAPTPPKEDDSSSVAAILERTLNADKERNEARAREAQERERVALMSPEEKANYETRKELDQIKRQLAVQYIETKENLDKTSIQSDKRLGPLYTKYRDRVEAKIKELRSQNNFTNREAVLYHELGKIMAESYKSGTPGRQKSAGKENISKATSKPTSGKTQVRVTGRGEANSRQARAERLANVRL